MHVCHGGQRKITELRCCSCIKIRLGNEFVYITFFFALKMFSEYIYIYNVKLMLGRHGSPDPFGRDYAGW